MKLTDSSDKDAKGPGLGSDPVCQTILIVASLSSYNFDGCPMGQPIYLKKFLIQYDLKLLCTLILFLHCT